ncbi:MAG: thioesterase family protein [Alphaproteobacteria bacterium]|nr:thioesterase family protein [Alphaproteobacteria bacterium]
MPPIAPLPPHRGTVQQAWVDYNDHMNVGFYVVAFDQATDVVLEAVDLGERYRKATDRSIFVAELHVTYQNELRLGEGYAVDTLLLGSDAKRIHMMHVMTRAADGARAATCELLLMHVDLKERRAVPVPEPQAGQLAALARAQAGVARPPETGRAVSLAAKRPIA